MPWEGNVQHTSACHLHEYPRCEGQPLVDVHSAGQASVALGSHPGAERVAKLPTAPHGMTGRGLLTRVSGAFPEKLGNSRYQNRASTDLSCLRSNSQPSPCRQVRYSALHACYSDDPPIGMSVCAEPHGECRRLANKRYVTYAFATRKLSQQIGDSHRVWHENGKSGLLCAQRCGVRQSVRKAHQRGSGAAFATAARGPSRRSETKRAAESTNGRQHTLQVCLMPLQL